MEVMLKGVRLAFWNGFKAKKFGRGDSDGEPRFSTAMFIEPKSDNHKALLAAMDKVAAEEWEKNWKTVAAAIKQDRKSCCLYEGTLLNGEGEPYEGAEGFFVLNAGQAESKGAPLVIDSHKDESGQFPRLTAKDGRPYSGCYANVKVDVWAQNNDFGRAFRASLVTVQFAKHGDSFGGALKRTDEGFEEVEDDGSEADDIA